MVTYAQLDERSDRVHGLLRSLGVGPGSAVAVMMPNRVEFVEITVGVAKAGAHLVPISYLDQAPQVAHILHDSAARVIFHDPACAPAVDASGASAVPIPLAEPGRPGGRYASALADALRAPEPVRGDASRILYVGYTSGSTGRPKGVVKSHASVTLLGLAVGVQWGLRPGDTQLMTMPMCHSGALWQMVFNLVLGGTIGLTPVGGFSPEAVLELTERWSANWTILVPTMSDLLIRHGAAGQVIDSMRVVVSGSAPMFTSTKEGLLGLFPQASLNETYGATETGIVTNLGPADQLRKQRCVGRPMLGAEVRVVDAEGAEAPAGEVGEIAVRSPYLFDRYHDLPERTADASRPGGFCTVGDLARRDDEGFFYIVDRKQDMVISGGLNIYPAEVEEVLNAHSGVAEAVVVGTSDERWGERVVAVVIPLPGTGETELLRHCAERLPRYKVPKEILFWTELPKLVSGKNARRLVRERLAEEERST